MGAGGGLSSRLAPPHFNHCLMASLAPILFFKYPLILVHRCQSYSLLYFRTDVRACFKIILDQIHSVTIRYKANRYTDAIDYTDYRHYLFTLLQKLTGCNVNVCLQRFHWS